MLIIPKNIIDWNINNEDTKTDYNVLHFNTTAGSVKDIRNEIYLKKISSSYDTNNLNDLYDVILISEILKRISNSEDMIYCKIVHHFNGISRMPKDKDNLLERFESLCLFPNISYSCGVLDSPNRYRDITRSMKVRFYKHGTRTINDVEYMDKANVAIEQDFGNDDNDLLERAKNNNLDNDSKYFDITDPLHPEAHVYNMGDYSRCLEMRDKYSGKELLSLLNLSIKEIDVSPELEDMYENKRSADLRAKLMNYDQTNINDAVVDDLSLAIGMRMSLRNILVDFMRISICYLMDGLELIYCYDPISNIEDSGYKKVTIPVDKMTQLFNENLFMILRNFTDLCNKSTYDLKETMLHPSMHYTIRIYLCDKPFELIGKMTIFVGEKILSSETLRMLKTEALHDYVIEGAHTSNGMNIVRNIDRLLIKKD